MTLTIVSTGAATDGSEASFSPVDFTVDAGTTIAIVNEDSVAHTVTSESTDDAFAPGAVAGVSFDSGQIQPSGTSNTPNPPYVTSNAAETATAQITIPASAPSGTVIPYFCQNHRGMMATPNGHITVR